MPYKYSFDETSPGNARFQKSTYSFYQQGLKRLRSLLDEWNTKAGTESHPYKREVGDLTRMIEWGEDRLTQLKDYDDVSITGISHGTLRYLKAAARLRVLEKEKEISKNEKLQFPSGVLEAMQRDLQEMSRKDEIIKIEPADCLWEVIRRPADTSDRASTPMTESRSSKKPTRGVEKKWDFFISHASEESDLARSLATKLQEKGFRVWYDEFVLTVGDSLLEKIDQGLGQSHYGVVILSHAFFNKRWTKRELDGLAALEANRKSQKVILPVWHNL
jgi:hypothetical protein